MDITNCAIANANTNANTNSSNLLSQQFNTKNQLDNILNQALNAIQNTPEQQREQNSNILEQKYLDAKTNLQTAPSQVEETKKNYYVYTNGTAYYNNMREDELKKNAETLSKNISDKFNEETNNAYTMNAYYNTDTINSQNTIELYEEYLKKNSKLENEIKNSHGDIVTNDRKTYYEYDAVDSAKQWHKLLKIVYYILVCAYIISIFVSPNEMSRVKQVGLIVLLVLYPFLMDKLIVDWFVKWFFNYKPSDENVYFTL